MIIQIVSLGNLACTSCAQGEYDSKPCRNDTLDGNRQCARMLTVVKDWNGYWMDGMWA
jgi:hypothetical protein